MINRLGAHALLLALAVACVTPMKVADIERLTTCKGKGFEQIRQSLLLAGYEIKNETKLDLTTDYKQVGGFGRDRRLRRITVVKLDEQTFRFRVRNKEIRIDRENHGAVGFGNDRKKDAGTVIIDLSQPVETVQEFDEDYHEESREIYEETQREVCGPS